MPCFETFKPLDHCARSAGGVAKRAGIRPCHLVDEACARRVGPIDIHHMRVLRLGRAEGGKVHGGRRELDGLARGPVKAPVQAVFEVIPVVVNARAPLDAVAEDRVGEVA